MTKQEFFENEILLFQDYDLDYDPDEDDIDSEDDDCE